MNALNKYKHIEVAFSPNKSGSRQKFVLTVVADGRLQRSVCLLGARPAVQLQSKPRSFPDPAQKHFFLFLKPESFYFVVIFFIKQTFKRA